MKYKDFEEQDVDQIVLLLKHIYECAATIAVSLIVITVFVILLFGAAVK